MIILSKLPQKFSGSDLYTSIVVPRLAQEYLLHQFVQDPPTGSAATNINNRLREFVFWRRG
jgi:hypothetical protein